MLGLGLNDFILKNNKSIKTIKLESEDNTYIYSLAPDLNYYNDDKVWLYYGGELDIMNIFVKFNLEAFSGKKIISTKLILERKVDFNTLFNSQVRYIKSDFDNETVTWNTKPNLDSIGYDTHLHSNQEFETWDITTLVQLIVSGLIIDFYGFALVPTVINYPGDEYKKKCFLEIKYV